jgi:hypothetical protein
MATETVPYLGVSTRLPGLLWKRVKAYCVKEEITVQDFLIRVLTKAVTKNGSSK